MIEITYTRRENKVVIQGHAGAGKKGEDIVCAGVSALANTLAANVRHWDKFQKLDGQPKTFLQEGFGEISCNPKPRYEQSVKQVFTAICAGFELCAVSAPEHVHFTIE